MVEFTPVAAEEIPGKRVTAKICELCSKGFFREKYERECKACLLRIAAVAAAPVPAKKAATNQSWGGQQPVVRIGTKPQMTAAQQAVWDAWLAEQQSAPKPVRRRTVRYLGVPRLTPEERKRRQNESRRRWRLRMGMKPRPERTPEERRENARERRRQYQARKRALRKMSGASTAVQ
jgi:hypothetical protein